MIPTILGIMLISFIDHPVRAGRTRSSASSRSFRASTSARPRASRGGGSEVGQSQGTQATAGAADASSKYRGAQGLDPKFVAELEKQFGFDKPAWERFLLMVKNYAMFDFGRSYFRDEKVIKLIGEKLPVSISLGLWMTLISYSISIPLGIAKAVRDGSKFDAWTSNLIVIGNAVPSFLFAMLLIVLFCGGSFWQIFPLRGLSSENFAELSLPARSATICGTSRCPSSR